MRGAIASILLIFVSGCGGPSSPQPSLISESKNNSLRVSIVELPAGIDRNFEVWVEQRASGFKTNIFRSPDEGLPGTERIIWRRDHSQFVIVGRNFAIDDRPPFPMEALYLLYDVSTGKVWCNANQKDAPRFTVSELKNWDGGYENDVLRQTSRK